MRLETKVGSANIFEVARGGQITENTEKKGSEIRQKIIVGGKQS